MTRIIRYWLRFALTVVGAGVAGFTQGEWLGSIVAALSASTGMLQQGPTDPRLKEPDIKE